MTTKTPSKYLSRDFLKAVLIDNCVTESGKEYDENELKALLIQKEIEAGEAQADELLNLMALNAA